MSKSNLSQAQNPKDVAREVTEKITSGTTQEECNEVQQVIENLVLERDEVHNLKENVGELTGAVKNLAEKVTDAIKTGEDSFEEFRGAHKRLKQEVRNIDERRKEDRRKSNERHDKSESEIQQLKHMQIGIKTSSDMNFDLTQKVYKLLLSQDPATSAPKESVLSKVPWGAWLAGAVVVVGVASMFTGQFDSFMRAFDKNPQKSQEVKQ